MLERTCPSSCGQGAHRGGRKGLLHPIHSPMSTPTFRFQKDAPRLSLCLSSSASQGLSDDKLFQEESQSMGNKLKYTPTLYGAGEFLSFSTCTAKNTDAWKTDEWLNWSCCKLLTNICITQCLWEISVGLYGIGARAISVGIQVRERKWWIVKSSQTTH